MKVTIDLPVSEIQEICEITGERKKGPAIRKLVAEALMLKRRAALAEKFISGEWGINVDAYEAGQAEEQRSALTGEHRWRD